MSDISLSTGRSLIQPPSQLTIQTDVSKTDWGAFPNNVETVSVWSSMEKTQHINFLELKAVYDTLLTFPKETKTQTFTSRHICPDISSEDGENSEFRNNKNFQGNFDVFVEQKHLNDRRVSAQQTELCR